MIIGVDIGGTFTDVVAADPDKDWVWFAKFLTNSENVIAGIAAGVRKLIDEEDVDAGDIERIVHGTTIATNIIVQSNGAKTAILTTKGFEDVLEIGRLKRRKMYDLDIDSQTPIFLAPRRRRIGIMERIASDGQVIQPLDEKAVREQVRNLKNSGVEAIAVVYLFSFNNPAHEIRTREIIREEAPEIFVSISSEVDPVYREYERTVVTAFDAYLRPRVESFITNLQGTLRNAGIRSEIYVMQSRGGVSPARSVGRRPVNLFLSGPAGGVVGSVQLAAEAGFRDIITIDIGGTSCDISLVNGGKLSITAAGEISGYPVRVPMIDINTIGAGGGSIVWIDSGRALRVGPLSAGSSPGPICYGLGGKGPTITDASAALGYLSPEGFAGGELQLNVNAAREGLENLGQMLCLSAVDVALGAHRIMNVQISEQIRLLTIKRGYDPRRFALFAFGGAGPVQAGAIMSMMGIERCIIPAIPGVLSAYGLLTADLEIDQGITFLKPVSEIEPGELKRAMEDLSKRCLTIMQEDGGSAVGAVVEFSADLRYVGQSYEINIRLTNDHTHKDLLKRMRNDFEQTYETIYGYAHRQNIEMVNLRAVATRTFKNRTRLPRVNARKTTQGAPQQRKRPVWFIGQHEPVPTPILQRTDLHPGIRIAGPCIIEQPDTTIVVYPGQNAYLNDSQNLLLEGIAEGYTV